MQRLLDFLYQQREIGIFLVLEILSVWLLINYNNRYNATFFNSSNEVAATVAGASDDISDYFQLADMNQQLMLENDSLKKQLMTIKDSKDSYVDTLGRYEVISAKVISNTFNRSANFLTISAGKKADVEVGMAVVSANGVVGQVKAVSSNFATIYSLLHPKLLVSSKVKRTQTKCTVQWDQEGYEYAGLRYIPRHIKLQEGDSIVTSGYNSVFPEGIVIGVVDQIELQDHMTFYEARIKLSTDFTSLFQVFVIKDTLKQEIDSLINYE